ncbi:E3 ubiquitin-protein ligase TRIM71-like [Glandiceps talaboti]
MATAAPALDTFLAEFGEGFLSCSVCLEQYKNPKILPCQHTFCQDCLVTLVKKTGKLNCSTCDTRVTLPVKGMSELQDNFFMNSLLNLVKNTKPSDVSEPGLCEGCEENTATYRCVDCNLNFCPNCTKTHRRMAMTRNHNVVELEEFKEVKTTSRLLRQQNVYCNIHPENAVKYFCETCQVTMCTDCAMIKHRSEKHVHRELKDVADEYITKLTELVAKLRRKEKEMERCRSEAKQTKERLQVKCLEDETKVRKKAEEMVQKIRKEEKRLVDELKTEYGQKVKTTEVQIDEWEMKHGNISSTCGYLETFMHHGSAAQLMSNKQDTVRHIQGLIAMDTKQQTKPEEVEFRPSADMSEKGMLGLLYRKTHSMDDTTSRGIKPVGHYVAMTTAASRPTQPTTEEKKSTDSSGSGSVVKPKSNDICAAQCVVENVPAKLLEDESGDIVIRTKDSQGRQVIPIPPVSAEMTKPDGTRQDVKVTDNRDGTLAFTVRGEVEGRHQVTMVIRDQPIPGSPFSIFVNRRLVKIIGKYGSGKGEFDSPYSVAMNKRRQHVVAEYGNRKIQVIDIYGNHVRSFTFTQFKNTFYPRDVAVSDDGNYLMTDYNNHQIVVSDENGKLLRCFGQNKLKYPHGITISPVDGAVYVTEWDLKIADNTDKTRHCVSKYTQDGKYISTFGKFGSGQGEFYGPKYPAISRQGLIYVPDQNNNRVQVFNEDCRFVFQFGQFGEDCGQLKWPDGAAVDNAGNVYITEQGNKRVQKFNSKGKFICRIDSDDARLMWPMGVAVTDDIPAKVIVADYQGNCLKVFTQLQ